MKTQSIIKAIDHAKKNKKAMNMILDGYQHNLIFTGIDCGNLDSVCVWVMDEDIKIAYIDTRSIIGVLFLDKSF